MPHTAIPACTPARRRLLLCTGAAALLSHAGIGRAQDRAPLRIVLPYPAGGILDITVRTVGPAMSRALNRPVIVDNRPGAAGLIGTRLVQTAAPDGNTILMHNIGFVGTPMMQKAANYDPVKDFLPVASLVDGPAFIVVHESVPARNLPELISYIRTTGVELPAATSGQGGASHISTMLFAKMAGIRLLPVPYKGGAEMQTALIGGEAKLMISNMSEVFSAQVKAGKLRLLAVASGQPSGLTPGLPMVQQAVPGFVIEGWNGLFAPAGTAAAEVTAISTAVKLAVDEPAFKERMAALYLEPRYQAPAEFAASVGKTGDFYRNVLRELNLTPQ